MFFYVFKMFVDLKVADKYPSQIEIKQLHSKYKLDGQQEQLYFVFLLEIPYVSSHCSLIIANCKSAMTSRNYWNSGRTNAWDRIQKLVILFQLHGGQLKRSADDFVLDIGYCIRSPLLYS